MLSWLRRLFATKADPTALVRAHEGGKELGQQLTSALDAYISSRAEDARNAFLTILQKRLPTLLAEAPIPPEDVAQEEWLSFMVEISNIEASLIEEVPRRFPDPFEVAAVIDSRPQLEAYLKERVSLVARELALEGALTVIRELKAECARRQIPLLDVPFEGDAAQWAGLQSAYVMALMAQSHMRQAITNYLNRRVTSIHDGYLQVLEGQLESHATAPMKERAGLLQAEWAIYQEQLAALHKALPSECRDRLSEWYRIAELSGSLDTIQDEVVARTKSLIDALTSDGEAKYRLSLMNLV